MWWSMCRMSGSSACIGLRVLAWGRQCAAAGSVMMGPAHGRGGVRAAGVGLPVFTRRASPIGARRQRDVAGGWRRGGGGGGDGIPSVERGCGFVAHGFERWGTLPRGAAAPLVLDFFWIFLLALPGMSVGACECHGWIGRKLMALLLLLLLLLMMMIMIRLVMKDAGAVPEITARIAGGAWPILRQPTRWGNENENKENHSAGCGHHFSSTCSAQ